jgi:hypothetical protein
LSNQFTGNIMRVVDVPLLRRQYQDTSNALNPRLKRALTFLRHCVQHVPRRTVCVQQAKEAPTLIWSDAMFEPGKPCRLGVIISFPRCKAPVAFTCILPEAILAQFVAKKTHIGQAEIYAALLGYASAPSLYNQASIIHFVDNISALAGLISFTSPKEDSASILGVYAVLLAQCGARVWAEYVESAANISDGVSRDGLLDLMAKKLGCDVKEGSLLDSGERPVGRSAPVLPPASVRRKQAA